MSTNHKQWFGTFKNEKRGKVCYLEIYHTNYLFLESTYNTDSHSKISSVGKDFEKNIYTYKLCNNSQRDISFESYCIIKSIE